MTSAGTRVLVVDDDQTLRRSVAGGVASWGFSAEEACDGHEALAKVKTFSPHVLVTDLVMPRVDGFELLRALKAQGRVPPVILLSAFGNCDIAAQAVHELGAFWFLNKPIRFDALRMLLERAVAQSALAREGAPLPPQPASQGAPTNMAGASGAMQKVFSQIHRVAPSRA